MKMKRVLIVAIAVTTYFIMLANPITKPWVQISELCFDDSGWTVEVGFYELLPQGWYPFDSLRLRSSTGSVTLKQLALPDSGDQLIVIKQGDFSPTIDINKLGDSVGVTAYFSKGVDKSSDKMVFGAFKGASIGSPGAGQSIALKDNPYHAPGTFYVKCNHPTPGYWNDSTGCCGTLKGVLYTDDNKPVKDMKFSLDFPFTTASDGSFETPIYARNKIISTVGQYIGIGYIRSKYVNYFSYDIEPCQQVTNDIHLLEALSDAADEPDPGVAIASFFPNPLTEGSALSYTTVIPVRSVKINIEVYNEAGKLVMTKAVEQPEGRISLPDNLKNGVYFLNLTSGAKVYASTKIAVLR
jgi:hypothetical protein